MKRRDALAAACDLVSEALPAVVRREDGSWQHVVGVLIDEVPCFEISCVAIGRTREEEAILLSPRVAGRSDERIPLFHDPPGQPEELLPEPLLARGGASEYRWTAERDDLRARIAQSARARWASWRSEASEVFLRGPDSWASACERVAALRDPLRFMALQGEQRTGDLVGLALPVRDAWMRGHWTAAWIGLGDVLDRVVPCDAATAARIASAARMVRASQHAPGHG